jgi:hypothetical protein
MQPEPDKKLISIERVVAFVVGPIVIALSGTLSAFLATEVGVNISAPEITGAFATGGLAAGALAWKWLHGRQLSESLQHDLPAGVTNVVGTSLGSPFIKTTIEDLEHLARHAAETVVASKRPADESKAAAVNGGSSPPAEPIPPAASDPAPSSAAQGQSADAGAASGQ